MDLPRKKHKRRLTPPPAHQRKEISKYLPGRQLQRGDRALWMAGCFYRAKTRPFQTDDPRVGRSRRLHLIKKGWGFINQERDGLDTG